MQLQTIRDNFPELIQIQHIQSVWDVDVYLYKAAVGHNGSTSDRRLKEERHFELFYACLKKHKTNNTLRIRTANKKHK